MVESYIAKLKLTPEEYNNYNPQPGVDLIKLEEGIIRPGEEEKYFVVVFVGSDLNPNRLLQHTASDIRHDVLTAFKRTQILEDNITTHPMLPPRLQKIETILDHPNVTSHVSRELKMAAEAATEVHDVELTKEQFDEIKKDRESGRELEPKEIRRQRRQVVERQGDGRAIIRDSAGKEEESYVVQMGVVDIG